MPLVKLKTWQDYRVGFCFMKEDTTFIESEFREQAAKDVPITRVLLFLAPRIQLLNSKYSPRECNCDCR